MFDRKTIIRSSQYADDEFPPCFHHKFSLFSAKIPAQCQETHRRSSRTTPIIVFSLRMKLYSNFKLIFHSILLAVAAAFLEALCRNGAEITVRRARPHRWNEREFSLPIACGSLVFLSSSTHTPHHFPLFFDFFFAHLQTSLKYYLPSLRLQPMSPAFLFHEKRKQSTIFSAREISQLSKYLS